MSFQTYLLLGILFAVCSIGHTVRVATSPNPDAMRAEIRARNKKLLRFGLLGWAVFAVLFAVLWVIASSYGVPVGTMLYLHLTGVL